jgi:pilus assembly protein Flp/PilA
VKTLTVNDSGATAMEYALIASLISIVIVAGLTSMGTSLSGFFSSVATSLR